MWAGERLGVRLETLIWSLNPGYAQHKWDGDVDPLAKGLRALVTHRRIGIESGTTTGKTFAFVAIAPLWFLDCWEDATVVTLAPKAKQLELHGWKIISRLWPRFHHWHPTAQLSRLRLRMRPGTDTWAAHGFPVGVGAGEFSATKAQGFHDEHMLFVFEEMPGQEDPVIVAVEQACKAPHNIMIGLGNPDHQLDALHKFCTGADTMHIRISETDHPNVVCNDPQIVPGAVSREAVAADLKRYGESHPFYRSRVRGESPAEATDSLIKLKWLYAARDAKRPDGWQGMPRAWGIDVANSEAGDPAAVARGRGPVCESVEAFPCPDANILGDTLAIEVRNQYADVLDGGGDGDGHGPKIASLGDRVGVDPVGVGVGTLNQMKAAGLNVRGLNAGGAMIPGLKPWFDAREVFENLGAQMHWLARQDLEHGRVYVPDDEELFEELIARTWSPKRGKIVLEPKDDVRVRLGRSPNKADGFVFWNWVRQIPARLRSATMTPWYPGKDKKPGDGNGHRDPMTVPAGVGAPVQFAGRRR